MNVTRSPCVYRSVTLHPHASTSCVPCVFPTQPYLSVMLNKGSLEVLVFTGSHNTRRVVRRADQGVLHDSREHALRIERLAGR